MAMINCPECKAEVSSQARACPKCGCPVAGSPAAAAATASNNPTLVRDGLIYSAWFVNLIHMVTVLAYPRPRSRNAEETMYITVGIMLVAVIVINGFILWRDRVQILKHIPGKAPSVAVTLLYPRLVYLDQRRKALGRGTWMVAVDFIAFWIPPIVSVFV